MALIRPTKKESAAVNEYVKMRAYLKDEFKYSDEHFEELNWIAEFLIDMWKFSDKIWEHLKGDGIK